MKFETFKQGLTELENAFDGFRLTESKIKVWYKYSKDITDQDWTTKIANCIRGCARIPTLADVIDWRGYHINKKEEEKLMVDKKNITWEKTKEEEEKIEWKPIPPKIKKFMDKVLHRPKKSEQYRKELGELENN